MRKLIIAMVMLMLFTATATMAQEDKSMYTDGAGSYQIPIPVGWDNQSGPEMAHFLNTANEANLYALVVEADSVQTGIEIAMKRIQAEFAAKPVQTAEVPLPGGTTWIQNVYALPQGMIVAALGRTVDNLTYIIAIFAQQSVLVAESATLNQTLLGHTIIGEKSAAIQVADYVDTNSFTEHAVKVVTGTYELPGTFTMPIGDGPFPAIVIVHGSGPNDRDGTLGLNKPYRDIAQGLASKGIAVLRYDKRTFVYRDPVAGFTIDDEVTNDALSAVQLLRGLDKIDPNRIYVLGHSQGAMFAPRIAERDTSIAGIILMASTPFSFDKVLSTQIDYLRNLDPNADVGGLDVLVEVLNAIRGGADPLTAFGGDETQAAYWSSMIDYTPGETALKIQQKMLILQGERDYQTTMADFAAWKKLLSGNDKIKFVSYPTLNHIFMALGDIKRMAIPADYSQAGFVDSAVINDIVDWISG